MNREFGGNWAIHREQKPIMERKTQILEEQKEFTKVLTLATVILAISSAIEIILLIIQLNIQKSNTLIEAFPKIILLMIILLLVGILAIYQIIKSKKTGSLK